MMTSLLEQLLQKIQHLANVDREGAIAITALILVLVFVSLLSWRGRVKRRRWSRIKAEEENKRNQKIEALTERFTEIASFLSGELNEAFGDVVCRTCAETEFEVIGVSPNARSLQLRCTYCDTKARWKATKLDTSEIKQHFDDLHSIRDELLQMGLKVEFIVQGEINPLLRGESNVALSPQEKGLNLEHKAAELFSAMGFNVRKTSTSGDGGVDLYLWKDDPITGGLYIVQCKNYEGSIGQPAIRDFLGTVIHENAIQGIFLTTSNFTKAALEFAQDKHIRLISGHEFKSLCDEYLNE